MRDSSCCLSPCFLPESGVGSSKAELSIARDSLASPVDGMHAKFISVNSRASPSAARERRKKLSPRLKPRKRVRACFTVQLVVTCRASRRRRILREREREREGKEVAPFLARNERPFCFARSCAGEGKMLARTHERMRREFQRTFRKLRAPVGRLFSRLKKRKRRWSPHGVSVPRSRDQIEPVRPRRDENGSFTKSARCGLNGQSACTVSPRARGGRVQLYNGRTTRRSHSCRKYTSADYRALVAARRRQIGPGPARLGPVAFGVAPRRILNFRQFSSERIRALRRGVPRVRAGIIGTVD